MDNHLVPGDPVLVEKIVNHLKAKGIFDEFRHECLADVDTKSSCQNLSQRVDGYTTKFLDSETWNPDLNKNELRNKLRRHIDESGMLAVGADHVVEQVINPKIHQLFLPKIIEVVHQYVQQETEKLKKKDDVTEYTKYGKTLTEKSEKPKPVILDPIADILSFTYPKPKQTVQTSASNAQSKLGDQVKSEKKKEDIAVQSKSTESVVKLEKKKEDILPEKSQDPPIKVKKEEISLPPKPQTTALIAEKKEEVSDSSIKTPSIESSDENSQPTLPQSKATEVKVKKEIKIEEPDASVEGQKKAKEELKSEKKKTEEAKVLKSEGSSQSDETIASKPYNPSSKSGSNHSKNKSETEKKKVKSHCQHKSSTSSDPNKVKTKDSSSSTSSKLSEKHVKTSSKNLKASKDSSPFKVSSSKPQKSEREEGSKSKLVESRSKSPDSTGKKNAPSKPNASKKESVPSKVKHSSDKQKSVALHQSHREHSVDKVKKSAHYSSSYDSSQGSDVDKSSMSSVGTKEKQKHFSKHHKKDKNRDDVRPSSKDVKEQPSDKKRPHHDSDSGADQKHKSGKYSSKVSTEKQKKSSVQTTAKIDSRSNSLGSTSSTSDSQNSSSKDNILTLSEDTSDAVPKPTEKTEKKKKPASKESEHCKAGKNLPPPPPPPPTSSLGFGTPSSADISSMDETQSSQESEFENYSSPAESSSDSEEEKEEVSVKKDSKASGDKVSLYDVFLRSSSSSEFEGFQSSPEKGPGQDKGLISDASTSTVHTSDLSSFDDEISHTDDSDSEAEDKKVKRKFTLKEAENLLRVKAEKRRSSIKNATPETPISEGKASNTSLQCSVASSEEDLSQRPEPKRESRRERKLNPKYASSEYTSIFNSKRTSFITKTPNQLEQTSPNPSPERSADIKKNEIDPKKVKERLSSSRRNLFSSSSEAKSSSKSEMDNEFEAPVTPTCSFNTMALPSNSISCDGKATSDKKFGNEGDTPNRIALKIKMSASKNDNQMNTEKMVKSVKRKYDGVTPSAKRPCNKVVPVENVANENEPFNKTSKSGVVLSVEQKEFFQKPKTSNNGDVLNKIEHAKNSFPNTNHVADNNPSD